MAVWIEIDPAVAGAFDNMSQPAMAVWIEIGSGAGVDRWCTASQPAVAVWIEIPLPGVHNWYGIVTACYGCVHRNKDSGIVCVHVLESQLAITSAQIARASHNSIIINTMLRTQSPRLQKQ